MGTYPQEVPAVNGISNYTLGTYPTEAPDITGSASYTGSFPTSAPTLYGTVVYTASFGHFAHGTRNAPEGLAYLNDDGSADPRELVEHNGQFLMYEGRNVLVPLAAGDRVFTSSETKDILSDVVFRIMRQDLIMTLLKLKKYKVLVHQVEQM